MPAKKCQPMPTFNGNTKSYQYYKFEITANGGDMGMEIGEMAINVCDHEWQTHNRIEPTCTATGMERCSCKTCGYYYQVALLEALGHDWDDDLRCTRCQAKAVVQVGDSYYPDIALAFKSVATHSTIKLLQNIDINSTLTASVDNTTLDLNGYTLNLINSENSSCTVLTIPQNCAMTLTDSSTAQTGTIKGGRGNSGGGVYVAGTFTMNGGTITDSTAQQGGGVYIGQGTFNMNGGKISNCSAPSGGGVYVGNGTFTMTDGTISNCSATNIGGGGVYVNGKSFTLNGGTISNCSGAFGGGGVYVENATLSMNGGIISNCSAVNGGGIAAISISLGTTVATKLTFNGGTISDNEAQNGGGFSVAGRNSTVDMQKIVITNNNCTVSGGGVIHEANEFSVGLDAQIYNNTLQSSSEAEAVQNNLYLCDGRVVKVKKSSTSSSQPTMRIGVTIEGDVGGDVTSANRNDYSAYFTSDSDKFGVGYRNYTTQLLCYHMVRFEGAMDNVKTVLSGDTVSEPTYLLDIPTHNLIGWFLNDSEYDFSTPVTSDITLKPKYLSHQQVDLVLSKNNLYLANVPVGLYTTVGYSGAEAYIATYSGGRLLSVYRMYPDQGNSTIALNTMGLDLENADTISAFLWNNSAMKPQCTSDSLSLTSN